MMMKRARRGKEMLVKIMAYVSDQDTLLPRSSPARRQKTAMTRLNAPRKSMRRSFSLQCESSGLARSSTEYTTTLAKMERGN